MYFKRKELCNKKTDTLKSILISKGDDMSLYTIKLINDLEQKLTLQGVSTSEVFKAYGKPFTSGRDLWDWLKINCHIRLKT